MIDPRYGTAFLPTERWMDINNVSEWERLVAGFESRLHVPNGPPDYPCQVFSEIHEKPGGERYFKHTFRRPAQPE